jgi:hypothetical protein
MADELDHLPLPPPEPEPHIALGFPGSERRIPTRDPRAHAEVLQGQLNTLEQRLAEIGSEPRPERSEGFLYAANFAKESDPRVESLSDKHTDTKLVDYNDEERRALVYTPRPKARALRKKIAKYGNVEDTTKTGKPHNRLLVAPLETLTPATLVDLSDGWLREDALPGSEWVEVWLRGGERDDADSRERRRLALQEFLDGHGLLPEATVAGDLQAFRATEHDIYLLKLSDAALYDLPSQLPEVFHLGPPQRTIVPQMLEMQKNELGVPEVADPPESASTVVLLDTGVSETHPLLKSLFIDSGSSSIAGDPSSDDSAGHGTRMAGLAAYGALGNHLQQGGPVSPRCLLQNVRIHSGAENPGPEPMLERTRDAVLEAEQVQASRRIFNLPLGARTSKPGGTTPWSVAVDSLAFAGGGRLFCVAAGNEPINKMPKPGDYFAANLSSGLTSPGEALNPITIGAITDLTTLDPGSAGRKPLAAAGQLNPSSRCDVGGIRALKPDLVFEGGNLSADANGCRADEAMQLLTTARGHATGPWLTTASMTSAATSRVSGLAAEIWQANPTRRPETIRALLIHSARWTPAMRQQFPDKRDLFRAVGYGTPSREKATWSEYTRPTVIFEGKLHPLRWLDVPGEKKRGREMHFHELPMPDEALESLGDQEIELSVTLAYFAQPNETRGVRYMSAGLRWEMQRPLESPSDFRKRINKLEREEGEKFKSGAEKIPWDLGREARGRGTVQSDRARLSPTQLLGSRAIAVWPVQGWWHDRKIEGDPALRYSLVITIDAGDQEVDLYTPILNEISVRTEIPA